MQPRWLASLGVLLILSRLCHGQGLGFVAPVGYLVPAASTSALAPAPPPPIPYLPRPGDIVLYDDFNSFHHFVFKLANTKPPTHVAMVIARGDGTPALLDLTGPSVIKGKVVILDVEPRLSNYPGTVMVRRLKEPLTVEQSKELTRFADAQVGKHFACCRVALQITPFCARTGLRKAIFGKNYLDRGRWLCSEMVVAAGVKVHLFDSSKHCANATYPGDFAYDERVDLSAQYDRPMPWRAGTPR